MALAPCAHCGEMIPEDATFCRHCGSDHETGWNPDIDYHSVEIPEYLTEDAEPVRERSAMKFGAAAVAMTFLVTGVVAFVGDPAQAFSLMAGLLFALWLVLVVFKRE